MEYDEMSEEDFEELRTRAEDNWETLKDDVLRLKEENQRLKNKMNTMAYTKIYVKKEDLGFIDKHFDKDLVSVDDLISCIEDLDSDIEKLKEDYEKLERDLEDNYVSRPRSDYTGDPDDDRY